MAILVQETDLTQAQILAISTTPIQILPAPAAGYVNVVLGVSLDMVYTGTPYVSADALVISSLPAMGQSILNDDGVFTTNSDASFPFGNTARQLVPFSTKRALYVNSNSNPIGAGSPITLFTLYETKPLVPAP